MEISLGICMWILGLKGLIHVPLHRWHFARILQIWSALVGYEELAGVGLSERLEVAGS